METKCTCGWRVFHERTLTLGCPQCGKSIVCDGKPKDVAAKKPAEWPMWAKAIGQLRKPSDAGVGDTFERLASASGGKLFKQWAKTLGIPCRCVERQAEWNDKYGY